MERVTLYVAHDDTGQLGTESISIPLAPEPQQRAAGILQALLNLYTAKGSTHPLSPDAEVRQVFLLDSATAVIDLNSAFIEGQISGVLPEELTVTSLVQSLATNVPGLTQSKNSGGRKRTRNLGWTRRPDRLLRCAAGCGSGEAIIAAIVAQR